MILPALHLIGCRVITDAGLWAMVDTFGDFDAIAAVIEQFATQDVHAYVASS
jgi:hypothetical protein